MPHTRTGLNRIVVGVDGSESAADAVAWAIKLARQTGAEIVPVFAVAPPTYADYAGMTLLAPITWDPGVKAELMAAFKGTWCRPLADSGLPYRPVIAEGRPATVIAEVAEAEGADLVVVGRRGRGTVTELLLGSVSHELAHHSATPVVLVGRHQPAAAKPTLREEAHVH
jgi:nucleotide-binding universal stress UspA family protein